MAWIGGTCRTRSNHGGAAITTAAVDDGRVDGAAPAHGGRVGAQHEIRRHLHVLADAGPGLRGDCYGRTVLAPHAGDRASARGGLPATPFAPLRAATSSTRDLQVDPAAARGVAVPVHPVLA